MESLNELLAQTSPICGGVLLGHGNTETVPDLNLGLIDLGSINWDLCDFVATTTSGGSVVNNLENQSVNLQENESANHYVEEEDDEDRRAVAEDETRCFEGLDLLDFELNEEVLFALSDFENLHHVHSTMSPTTTSVVRTEEVSSPIEQPQMLTDASYMSQINSPSAEQTYSNLDSMSTAMNTMNTAISSPAESTTLYGVGDDSVMNYYSPSASPSSSIEDSPAARSSNKIRRTRARTIDKKESNKAAAIKYRNKKMKERDSLFAECEEYAKRNAELKKKIDETQSEISFIKSLLVEALIAKSVPK